MRNLRFTVAYDGTNYSGWQRQTNALAVQELIEKALTKICKEQITIFGSGRTDAGVHALGQVVSFRTTCSIPVERLNAALNGLLPTDIVTREGQEVSSAFHARSSAKEKQYRYLIYNDPMPSPFCRHYAWQLFRPLDFRAMQQAAECFIGTHDFSAFRSTGGGPKKPVRTMYLSNWKRQGLFLEYEVRGTGFLYHMVRNMVGAMVAIGRNKIPADAISESLLSKERHLKWTTAPAHGLYLVSVTY